MNRCPKCSSLCVIPVVYGKAHQEFLEAASLGLVEVQGCVIDQETRNTKCLTCGNYWDLPDTWSVSREEFRRFTRQFADFLLENRQRIAEAVDNMGAVSVQYGQNINSRRSAALYRQMLDARASLGPMLDEGRHRFWHESEKLEEMLYGRERYGA